MALRKASDIAREARLYNDEPETPMLISRHADYAALILDGAEVVSQVHESDGSIHHLLSYDDLLFGYIERPAG